MACREVPADPPSPDRRRPPAPRERRRRNPLGCRPFRRSAAMVGDPVPGVDACPAFSLLGCPALAPVDVGLDVLMPSRAMGFSTVCATDSFCDGCQVPAPTAGPLVAVRYPSNYRAFVAVPTMRSRLGRVSCGPQPIRRLRQRLRGCLNLRRRLARTINNRAVPGIPAAPIFGNGYGLQVVPPDASSRPTQVVDLIVSGDRAH